MGNGPEMKKVLGVVCSHRKMGNTEVAVREVMRGAKGKGCATELLMLTDHLIEPCRGCMSCVFKGVECPIGDDAHGLLQRITGADALVVGVPTYILGAAGILKMLSDRSMWFMAGENRPAEGKPSVGVVTAGVPGWEGLAPAMLRVFLYSLGFKVIHLPILHAQGPAEVLLDGSKVKMLNHLGEDLAGALSGESLEPPPADDGTCPLCGESVLSLSRGKVRCLICGHGGRIDDSQVVWDEPGEWRWGPKEIRWHFDEQVRSSGPRYMSRAKELRRMVRDRYRDER